MRSREYVGGRKRWVPLGGEALEPRLNLSGDGVDLVADFQCDSELLGIKASPSADAVAAVDCFAIDLYQHFNNQDGNLLFSPLSISTALAMTAEGANGQTAAEMADVLYLQDGIDESYNALIEALVQDVEDGAANIEIANALWPQIGLEFRRSFLDQIADSYGGYAQGLDYANDPESYQVINEWTAEQTQGTIDQIFTEPLSPLTRIVLTNSIYFNANWAFEFDATRDSFQLESGERRTVDTMELYYESFANEDGAPGIRYWFLDDHEVVEIPYANGETSMVILLPAEQGFTFLFDSTISVDEDVSVDDLTPETLAKVNRRLNTPSDDVDAIRLTMPRFTNSVASDLKELLTGMGMPTAFDAGRADFSNMLDSPLSITDVLHSAFIDVNEVGTEAAAVTAVVGGGLCFAKGTPIRTANGTKRIEDVEVGDKVLSRSEADLNGSIRPKRVEELFRGTRPVIQIHVGGQVIRATDEHPFFVKNKGWVAAGKLEKGDQLSCGVASWKAVEKIVDHCEVVDVYNFRVAGFHTYFVGSDAWGFSLWTHNCCCDEIILNVDRPFHYFIRDTETSSILFMGRVMDPGQIENSHTVKVSDVRTLAEPAVPTEPQIREPFEVLANADGGILGDTDGDQTVGFNDFLVLWSNFGQETDLGDEAGDFNDDVIIDFADFLLLSHNFGQSLV